MKQAKKPSKTSKSKVQVRDLKPVKNPKGGTLTQCATGKHISKAVLM